VNVKKGRNRPDVFGELRRCAEAALQGRDSDADTLLAQQVRQLIHELEVHQIELEMQNEKLRRAQEKLEATRDKYTDLYDFAPIGYLTVSKNGQILEANLTAARLLGMERGVLRGQSLSRFIAPEDQDVYYKHRKAVLVAAIGQTCEKRRDFNIHPRIRAMGQDLQLISRRKDGTLVPLEISLSPVYQNEELMLTAIIQDISARKEAEVKLCRLNRTHAVLSRSNNILARSVDEKDLLSAFCSNLVEVGGYRFAWVGYSQQNRTRSVRRMAHAGHTDAALSITAVTWSDIEENVSACGMAIRTGKPVILRDIERESRFAPWRAIALQQGYRSMIALPIKANVQALGNLSIFSTEYNAFDADEVALLMELAENLAFGIETLRTRAAREQQVRLLRAEVEHTERKRIAETLHDGVAQAMQAVNLGLKRLRALAGKDKQLRTDLLDRSIEDIGGIIADLRDITHDLRPPFLERMELQDAIQYHCSELSAQTGVAIHVAGNDEALQLDDRVKEQCFLSLREALNNALTHAMGTRINVTLRALNSDWLIIRIADNGVGFKPWGGPNMPSGLGLSMISERAKSVGGHAEIHSTPGEGTTVSITAPLRSYPASTEVTAGFL
jgi:PAS domain S-box-containing protein